MNESIKELIESLPNEGVDCKGKEWVRCEPKSKNFIDLAGQTFERLYTLFPVKDKKANRTKWLCQCSCGNLIITEGSYLKNKRVRSCGCLHAELSAHMNDKKREKMIGERFGKLEVLSFEGVRNEKAIFKCRCDCGKEIVVRGNDLKSGGTTSCGCAKKEAIHKRYEKTWNLFIGTKINLLTATKFIGTENGNALFEFECECGNKTILPAYIVKSGGIKSCGCLAKETMHRKYRDIWSSFIGTKINFLTATKFIGTKNKKAMFEFECDCGNKTILPACDVKSGHIKSCGCIGSSYGEAFISKLLDDSKILYKKQQAFEDLRAEDTNYLLHYDFAILNENNEVVRLIEYDGRQHFQSVSHFGGEEEFVRRQYLDNLKNQYALSHNIPLTRIPYTEQDNLTLDLLFDDKYTITKQ